MARIFVLGATGTIGRVTVRALVAQGHDVVAFVRHGDVALPGAEIRVGNVVDGGAFARDGLRGEQFDVLVSCLASRTGAPADAWAIDYRANLTALNAAIDAGVGHAILLSAICVQKPRLAFQHAKLAMERALIGSGIDWTIVRPTAFFKSLSGQIARVRAGKAFVLFGDGELTACKPISDDDLGAFIADCVERADRRNKILPIGGPGPAITPREQGGRLFELLGREPKFRHVPVRLMDAVVRILGLVPGLGDKAELARIGRYYATESMLVLDPATNRYDAAATPEAGSETLFDFYARVLRDEAEVALGDPAVFQRS